MVSLMLYAEKNKSFILRKGQILAQLTAKKIRCLARETLAFKPYWCFVQKTGAA